MFTGENVMVTASIIQTLKQNKGSFFDSHGKGQMTAAKAFGVLTKHGTQYVFPMYSSGLYSINPIEMVDGDLKLSTRSLGVMDCYELSFKRQVEEFNRLPLEGKITQYFEV